MAVVNSNADVGRGCLICAGSIINHNAQIEDFCQIDCNAVIGISGGKDSSIAAALCVKALGAQRVIGVLMPCGEQSDIDAAKLLVSHLGIKHYIINIKDARDGLMANLPSNLEISKQTEIKLFIK